MCCIAEEMIESMVKNGSKKGVAIRFAEKLVNCNTQFCYAQNFLPYGKNETYFQKTKIKTAAKFIITAV